MEPKATIVMLDQPTIVPNAIGQRPVENIVDPIVSLPYGGMEPTSSSRREMFGPAAPVWQFLDRFGGAADRPEDAALVAAITSMAEISTSGSLPKEWKLPLS